MKKALPGLLALVLCAGAGRAAEPPRRTLLIALDAVPYEVVAELSDPARGEEALFPWMEPPAPLISTFPSTTSLAMAALLAPFGLEPSPGYEAKHFDRRRNRVRGGGPISYHRLRFPWRDFFDWKIKGLARKATSALRPIKTSLGAIRRSMDAFLASDEPVYFVYYDATDLAAHLRGPDSLRPILAALSARLAAARAADPERPFTTVLFSDHGITGGETLTNARRAVKRALREAGWHPARRLRRPRDVVFVPFGLISSFVAFTAAGEGPEAARAIVRAEGVDLCAAPLASEPEAWRVESRRGGAFIRRRREGARTLWRYQPTGGDPLGYAPVVEALERAGGGPWFEDGRWFRATHHHAYPDALYRIARAFELVENPASVACSLAPGHMFGSALTDYSGRLTVGALEWTHGALGREASYGFLMTDAAGWRSPPAARFSEALKPFVP